MAKFTQLLFPIEKATYLLTRETQPGEGGDKKKFWREIMGFSSPEMVRDAILNSVGVDSLAFQKHSRHGARYQAVSLVRNISGTPRRVRTGWIVRSGETVTRFVTAFPQH